MKNYTPVNIGQISTTLQYCQQRIEIITELIISEYPSSYSENVLSLLTSIHDVFDGISETTNALETSLNGIVGCVDLAVIDVQIAVQVLIEAFISNCDVLEKVENRSDAAMASAVYCLSSAIKTLLTSMSDLAEKIMASEEIVDVNAVNALQIIVQTILNIVDRVIYSIKYVQVFDIEGVDPNLEKLSLIIQRLANQRLNFVSKISPTIVSPISEVLDSLRSNIEQLPLRTGKGIEKLVETITRVENTVHEKNIAPAITSILNTLQPMLLNISNAIHSIEGITDSVKYSTDVSLENLIATIKCLISYIAITTNILPTVEAETIGVNIQKILCFIASNIQTLIDGITITVERTLIDLICLSPQIDKVLLEKQLLELQKLMEPVILTLEHIIRTSIQLVQNIISLASCAIGDMVGVITDDMNQLIKNLDRIVNELSGSVVDSRQLLTPDNRVDNVVDTSVSTHENIFSICIKAFEEVSRNSLELGVYFNKSIEQIRRCLIEL